MPRLFVIADVGGADRYHLGDEAMLEANLCAFRRLVPGIEFTIASLDPASTGTRYGVEAVQLPAVPAARPGDQWLGPEIGARVRDSQGLIVSGGGNLCSTWPEKILERIALLEFALDAEIPAVILGQTIGPHLTPDQRHMLAGPLQRSAWVGVREAPSALLASALGVPAGRLHRQVDDAFFLDPLPVQDERTRQLPDRNKPFIVVTLDASFGSGERERALSVLASQLDALADNLDAELVFVPHVGGAGEALDDRMAANALSAKLRSRLSILELWQPREIRWVTERAALVVSTRYHPLVFATAAAVPSLGIYTDDYTRVKLQGAHATAGVEGWCLSVADVERGMFLLLAKELWHRKSAIVNRLSCFRAEAWPKEQQRWEGICRVLRLTPSGSLGSKPIAGAPPKISEGSPAVSLLTEEQWQEYEQKGYLRLGKVLSGRELAGLRDRIDDIMMGRVRYPTLQMQLDTGGAYEDLPDPVEGLPDATLAYRKVQGLECDPLVLDLLRRDLFREICARHYGRHASVSIFRVMMMNKPAGKGTYLPWHQDAGDVWKLDRDPLVTSWIALDPATRRNGCVQVIPGSHRLGLLSKNGSTLSAAHADLYCPDDRVEYLELEAGEALLLHNWLLHRSDVNHTGEPRRALSACYMDGRTLSTLTGSRYPIVFGEHEDTKSAFPFLRGLVEESQQLREMLGESQRYAQSLLEDNRLRERMRLDAERYAQSLQEDNRLREQMRLDAERHALSLLEDHHRREEEPPKTGQCAKTSANLLSRFRAAVGRAIGP